jgi:beta-galactosidase
MESFGQSYGFILYRTRLTRGGREDLVAAGVRDYAQVFLDGRPVGSIDRRLQEDRLALDVAVGGATLDVLVENTGRVNFTKALREERKGLTSSVTFAGEELTGWDVFLLPLSAPPVAVYTPSIEAGAAFHRGNFRLASTGDTFLDMRGWGKGTVWINGHHLGRFWSIGPQQTLYVPGPWLKRGLNEVVVFCMTPPATHSLQALTHPIFELGR